MATPADGEVSAPEGAPPLPFGPDGPPLGFLLASVGFATMSAFRASLEPFDVHPRHFALLRALAAVEGRSQQDVAAMLHIPPSRMVSLVDDLERRGLVERRRNPRDRRTRSLALTAAGRRLLVSLFESAARHEERLFGGLSTTERSRLRALLAKVAAQMGLAPGEHPGMAHDEGRAAVRATCGTRGRPLGAVADTVVRPPG